MELTMPDVDGYNDVMVDLETTGTSPDRTAILQIAGVKFDLETGRVSHDFFDRCLEIPPHRFWDEGTRSWWSQQKRSVLLDILAKQEPVGAVLNDFVAWAHPATTYRFWSKPLSFDFPFIQSYMNDYGLPQPFHYRTAMDMNSFIRGRYFPLDVEFDGHVTFDGDAHNALFDTLYQVKILFHHYEATKR
jgi:hypothetical protein